MIMASLSRAFDLLLAGLALLAAFCIAGLAIGMTADVVMRNTGLGNITGMLDISEFLVFMTTFLGAPWVLKKGGHVNVDVAIQALGPEGRRIMAVLCDVFGLAVCVMLCLYGWLLADDAIAMKARIIRTFIFPEWWVYALVTLSGLLLSIEFLRRLWRHRRGAPVGGGTVQGA
jgi:TRAP-type C4-dicarboxylate transport system permease small subunit